MTETSKFRYARSIRWIFPVCAVGYLGVTIVRYSRAEEMTHDDLVGLSILLAMMMGTLLAWVFFEKTSLLLFGDQMVKKTPFWTTITPLSSVRKVIVYENVNAPARMVRVYGRHRVTIESMFENYDEVAAIVLEKCVNAEVIWR